MRNADQIIRPTEEAIGASSPGRETSGRHRADSQKEEMAILHLLKNRDPGVFDILRRKYHTKLSSVAFSICKNHEDVEEVLQDVYMTAIEKIDKFEQRSSLQTWLYRVTMNAALMKRRSQRKNRYNVPLETLGDSFGEEEDFFHAFGQVKNPEDALVDKELGEKLNDWVQGLPMTYQSVIQHRAEGYSIKETSERLHTTQAAVKSRMHRTRNNLRESFRHYFSEN